MLVKYWMSTNVITVAPGSSMQEAMRLIKTHHIHQLPVVASGKLSGMLSDGDLKRASASDATSLDVHELFYLLEKIKVADIMSKPAITIAPDHTLEEAAEILLEKKIASLPVAENDGKVIGIITQSDLFRALVSLTGLKDRGLHIATIMADRPGSIMEVANRIREAGGKMASILTSYERCPAGFRRVYFRAYEIKREKTDSLLADIAQCAELLYMVDHRENKRIIFSE